MVRRPGSPGRVRSPRPGPSGAGRGGGGRACAATTAGPPAGGSAPRSTASPAGGVPSRPTASGSSGDAAGRPGWRRGRTPSSSSTCIVTPTCPSPSSGGGRNVNRYDSPSIGRNGETWKSLSCAARTTPPSPLEVVEQVGVPVAEGVADLGDDHAQGPVGVVGEPPGHRVEHVAEHARVRVQQQRPVGQRGALAGDPAGQLLAQGQVRVPRWSVRGSPTGRRPAVPKPATPPRRRRGGRRRPAGARRGSGRRWGAAGGDGGPPCPRPPTHARPPSRRPPDPEARRHAQRGDEPVLVEAVAMVGAGEPRALLPLDLAHDRLRRDRRRA